MLATLVLNGEGSRLIGRRSQNTELQAFLENVPIYMVRPKFLVFSFILVSSELWYYYFHVAEKN